MRGEQIGLDELAGRLAVSAEEHRDAEVENDRECIPDHPVRMRITAITLEQHIRDRGFDDHAGRPASGQLPKFFPKPLPGVDHGGYEIVERLSLHGDPFLKTLDGVIPGRQRPPHGAGQPGIE